MQRPAYERALPYAIHPQEGGEGAGELSYQTLPALPRERLGAQRLVYDDAPARGFDGRFL